MDRFTISLDESLASQFDRLIAESLMAECGVRHGALNVVALEPEHAHGHGPQGSRHKHYRPLR